MADIYKKLVIPGLNSAQAFCLPMRMSSLPVKLEPIKALELAALCQMINESQVGTLLLTDLKKHTGGTYTYKQSLLESLSYIYLVLKAKKEGGNPEVEVKSEIAKVGARLSDGIKHCTPGFHDRVNSIVNSLGYQEITVMHSLYRYRVSLIEKAFCKTSDNVHVYNTFYRVANALGLGVLPNSKDDIHHGKVSDGDIITILFGTFRKEYTPFHIYFHVIDAIKTTLSEKLGYIGKCNAGYTSGQYEDFLLYIQTILEEDKKEYSLLEIEPSSGKIVDIDFPSLGAKLVSFMIKNEIYTDRASLLHLAINKGQIGFALALIEEGAKLDEKDSEGNTALILAAEKGYKEIVFALIEFGVTLDEKNNAGNTAYISSASNGHAEIALTLIKNGARYDETSVPGSTLLLWSAKYGYTEIALTLILNGVILNKKNTVGRTPFMLAAENGHTEIALTLIEYGVTLDEKDNQGHTALMLAAENGHTEIALSLIEHGSNLEEKDNTACTALILAAAYGHIEITRALIEKGARVDVKDEYGNTALVFATERGNIEIAEMLEIELKKIKESNPGMLAYIANTFFYFSQSTLFTKNPVSFDNEKMLQGKKRTGRDYSHNETVAQSIKRARMS